MPPSFKIFDKDILPGIAMYSFTAEKGEAEVARKGNFWLCNLF